MNQESTTSKLFEYDIDEARDLRSTFIFAGVLVVCMAALILAASDKVIALQIPPTQLTLVALAAAWVTMGGLFALERKWPTRAIAWVTLASYTVLLSIAVHFTGGPLTPFPAIYLVVVLGASFLLGRKGATVIAVLSSLCYAIILRLEYLGILSMVPIWQISFSPQQRGSLLVINWITLTVPTLIASQLAGTLAERLKKTNLHLRESERLRENLSDMIIHDLRNPITAMLGVVDVLRMTMGDNMRPEQQQLLEHARHSGHVMLGLVGELLDISKMEAGQFKVNLQPVDVCKILEENVSDVAALTEMEGQQVSVSACPAGRMVRCDRQLISRVVANLLSNAIKHTPPGGKIEVIAEQRNGELIVHVVDTGVGIPLEYQQHIFEKFGQVEDPSGVRRGTGLGLTFCKMAVEAHGGRIWVGSTPKEGSTFSFSLPNAVESPPAPSAG